MRARNKYQVPNLAGAIWYTKLQESEIETQRKGLLRGGMGRRKVDTNRIFSLLRVLSRPSAPYSNILRRSIHGDKFQTGSKISKRPPI